MGIPSISISITVFNLEKYIDRCISSILNQEFTDFELIIIDDGSTDNSGNICRKYEEFDDRIIYIYQSNQGVSSARNRALDISKGKYILMVDGDDYIEKTMVGKLFDLCEKNNASISTCKNCLVDEKGQVLGTPKFTKDVHILTNEEALFRLYSGQITGFGVCNKLYRKELLNNIRFPINRKFEDAAIQYRLIRQADRIVFTEERLYFYVIHSESMTRKKLVKYSENRLDIIKNFEETLIFLKESNISKSILDIVILDHYKSLKGLVIDIMRENKNERKRPLKIVIKQIVLWKELFLNNLYISKKEMIFIHLLFRLPKLTLAVYHFRNQLVINN